jgi:hypothetical protein
MTAHALKRSLYIHFVEDLVFSAIPDPPKGLKTLVFFSVEEALLNFAFRKNCIARQFPVDEEPPP